METQTRNCLSCGKTVKGRIDKKFCDDYCRSMYNNHLQATSSPVIRHVNNILKRNRRLLQEMLPANEEMGKCARSRLGEAGFNFRFFTHQYTNKKGNIYHFVYEYGYLALEGDWLLVVKRNTSPH